MAPILAALRTPGKRLLAELGGRPGLRLPGCWRAPVSSAAARLTQTSHAITNACSPSLSTSNMVIADTGFWLALANPRDAYHQAASDWLDRSDEGALIINPPKTKR